MPESTETDSGVAFAMEDLSQKAMDFMTKYESGTAEPAGGTVDAAQRTDQGHVDSSQGAQERSGEDGASGRSHGVPTAEQPATASPSSPSGEETAKNDAGGDTTKPTEPTETKEQIAPRTMKVLLGGKLVEVSEDSLIELANRGFNIERERHALLEKAREIESIAKELQPYREKLEEIKKREQEEQDDDDPFAKLLREHKELKSRLESIEKERQESIREVQKREAVSQLNASIEKSKERYKDFLSGLPDSVKNNLQRNIYGAIAFGGKDIDEAVAQEIAALKEVMSIDVHKRARSAIGRANTPPVPARGAPVTAPAVKMNRASLYNGEAFEAAMNLIRAREGKE